MRERGGREAFWWQGTSISYHDLDQRITAWERRLGSYGIGPGDPRRCWETIRPNPCP
jgi:hypothetical protein